ncbi:MAG: sulfurtransferase [Chloroflexi bacterium HGW-Chloroflexi-7]|nr:MAG: sulfurtransferase [Chloroflexi bacterium HGW-Chloroflexi-7]
MLDTLISTDELANHQNDPKWVLIDCRFDLVDKEWGAEEYAVVHIPGAVYADLEKDICGSVTPTSGRHPLPEPKNFIAAMQRMGIYHDSQVVVYDATGGGMAGRLWWQLKFYGHHNVMLLNGGLPKWLSEGRETVDGVESNPVGDFYGSPDDKMMVTTDEVKALLGSSTNAIIDARSPERFRGEIEPIDTVAGRIPGSMNRFYNYNLDGTGQFLPAEGLKTAFEALLAGLKPIDAVAYCGSGTTACHNLIAMAYAGLPLPRLYVGSWSEWIRDPKNPVGKG